MENASRALIISATVLLSVMLISFGTYLFATFGNYSKNINANLSAKQKQEFNAQFTKYEGGDLCTVYDIVTVINLAKDSNNQYEEYYNLEGRPENYNSDFNTYIYVDVDVDDYNIKECSHESVLNSFISSYNDTQLENGKIVYKTRFSCKVHISGETGLVKSIKFEKMN